MNTIFDFKRAGLLVQRHFIERFHGELMFWGVSIICMMFLRNSNAGIWGFAIITCIFRTGQFFREIHSPSNRINYFMIPATQVEKFTVSLFYTIVCFWTIMFAIYVAGNILGTYVNNLLANIGLFSNIFGFGHQDLNWSIFASTKHEIDVNLWNIHTVLESSIAILILQSIFILGGIYFKKNQTLKTFLALVIIGFVIGLIAAVEANSFLLDSVKTVAMRSELKLELAGNSIMKSVEITSSIFFYLLVPYLWFTSYIRLTEKEV
jgi:hypothetical protein